MPTSFDVKSALVSAVKRANADAHKVDAYISPLRLAFCRSAELVLASVEIPLNELSTYVENVES